MTAKEENELMVPINFRVPESLSKYVDGVVRLWRTNAIVAGDEYHHITTSYVVRRLLRSGADRAFEGFGGLPGMPTDDDGWKSLTEKVAATEMSAMKTAGVTRQKIKRKS
jgi:hypothetical protein